MKARKFTPFALPLLLLALSVLINYIDRSNPRERPSGRSSRNYLVNFTKSSCSEVATLSRGFQRANDLDCLTASQRRKPFHCARR